MSSPTQSPGGKLRQALAEHPIIVAPGAFEPMQARMIENLGYSAIYAGGSGISCAIYGRPDMGLTTMTEARDAAGNLAKAVDIPVLGDIEQGFGDLLNVRRSVREFERAGLAGVHIEDESGPSKHVHGSVPIPTAAMCEKIKIACDAREDPDFMVFGRCDSLNSQGLDETLERSRAYLDAGADGLWVLTGYEATPGEVEAIPKALPDVPLIYCWTVRGSESQLSLAQIEAMGYRMVVVPNLLLFGVIGEARRLLTEMKEKNSIAHLVDQIASIELVDEVVGLNEARDFQRTLTEPSYVVPGQKKWVLGGH